MISVIFAQQVYEIKNTWEEQALVKKVSHPYERKNSLNGSEATLLVHAPQSAELVYLAFELIS